MSDTKRKRYDNAASFLSGYNHEFNVKSMEDLLALDEIPTDHNYSVSALLTQIESVLRKVLFHGINLPDLTEEQLYEALEKKKEMLEKHHV
jgi:hypothetical protein